MTRPLEDVQDEILDRIHAGETVDREAILAAHPDHGQALEAFFDVLAIVEGTEDGVGLALARLGEFRIVREIGRGGMGRVYEAEQTSLKRRVALKVLPPTVRLDARRVSRFHREAEAAGRLRHPGIVPVYSVGEVAGTPFFAMELVEGNSLQEVLEKRRAGEDSGLPTEPEAWRRWAVETAAKVADALAYAHGQGILHRDVKPGNILLEESGEPRLTDFGLALDLRAPELTQTGEVFGSPQYMSPEQALRRGAPIDARTDVYSLAVTLYELLTLRLPYAGTTSPEILTALLSGDVVPPRRVDPAMPRALEQVLMGALHKDPKNRYRGAAELAHDLRATLKGAQPTFRPPAPLHQRLRVPLAVAGILALVAVGIALWPDRSLTADGEPEEPESAKRVADESEAADAVAQVMAEYDALDSSVTPADYELAITQLRALDGTASQEALRRVYQDFIDGPGRDDVRARAFLGYLEFPHQVPEAISFRRYPYLQVAEAAAEKRWFAPDEEDAYQVAMAALRETLRHAELLASDSRFRAADRVRANIGSDRILAKYHLTTRWGGSYLLCHLASESSSMFDEPALAQGVLRVASAAQAERRREIDRFLDASGGALAALSEEYWARYEKALGLRPLMDPWGGRPDLPLGVRSFEDGVPLVVLVFENRAAWLEYVTAGSNRPVPSTARAFFSPVTSILCLYAEGSAEPLLEQQLLIHEAVHQLQWWYRRQRAKWHGQAPRQDWFEDGLAEYLAGVRTEPDGSLTFTGRNATRLRSLQGVRDALRRQGKDYPFFRLGELVSFTSFGQVMQGAAGDLGVAGGLGLTLFYDQAWALTYFLNHGENGRFRKGFLKYADFALDPGWAASDPLKTLGFRKALGIDTEEKYGAFEAAFRSYVLDHLMKLDPDS